MKREQELNEIEIVMSQLKDFQCATVERVDELFRQGKNRVLVADEVGLGKTLIAKGVIAKTVHRHKPQNGIFRIVYVCSNQNIANQNIQKLDVFHVNHDKKYCDDRLSMQHLKIAEQEFNSTNNNEYVQLISFTPTTSFSMTNGGGTKNERALMLAILKRIDVFQKRIVVLNKFLSQDVADWDNLVEGYWKRIEIVKNTGYPENIITKIIDFDKENQIFNKVLKHLDELEDKKNPSETDNYVLMKLRKMFAEISVGMLHPNLVIMDEFQRFKYLIEESRDDNVEKTEENLIAKKFFETRDLKILLLSATPYKLYSTMEEIDENNNQDEAYKEFFQVMDFLINNKKKKEDFRKIWSDYSFSFKEIMQGDNAVLKLNKEKAEEEMYNIMCRTERVSVMDAGDYTDDKDVKALPISKGDIRTFLDMGELLKKIGKERFLLVDYAKSSPYLMSYMANYKIKSKIEDYFRDHPNEVKEAKGEYLWITPSQLEHYGEIPANNTRLEELKRQIFQNKSELYMWVPPSRPYYGLEGVYKNSKGFSKILVFSAWEMVPRMISCLISYEEERRTVGILSNDENINSNNNTYFHKKNRFPDAKLRFKISDNKPQGMYIFCLEYPSETLAEIYHPIDYMNVGYTLGEIRKELADKLSKKLQPIIDKYEQKTDKEDKRWYYVAPILLDDNEISFKDWCKIIKSDLDTDNTTEDTDKTGIQKHIEKLQLIIKDINTNKLGKAPSDLANILADMAIGSFAVCAFRSNGGDLKKATNLAKVFVNRFNTPEATATVMLAYNDDKIIDKNIQRYVRNVLRYCCDGGFGAMLDEYIHLVSDGSGFVLSEDKNQQIHETMLDALTIRSSHYDVDTYDSFKKRMKEGYENCQKMSMRTHYAVGFIKGKSSEAKNNNRIDSVRNAFNSPMRPFVLATTSIGQEGLDFHQYCRKIMHWNLPSNPIDLEQREGRINRYKCLAIRQDIAQRFADREFVSGDVWQELFALASDEIRQKGQSELVPYWCLGKDQQVKIERIVPMYPVSKDEINYQRLIKVLSLYRLTMGQARQEELIDYILESGGINDKELQELFINLSPYKRTDEKWKEKLNARKPIAVQKKKSERQNRIEQLRDEINSKKNEVDYLIEEINKYPTDEIVGMIVKHKNFGEGKVAFYDGAYIKVNFPVGEKMFPMPQAFEQKFLVPVPEDYFDNVKKRKELEEQKSELQNLINSLQEQCDKLVI